MNIVFRLGIGEMSKCGTGDTTSAGNTRTKGIVDVVLPVLQNKKRKLGKPSTMVGASKNQGRLFKGKENIQVLLVLTILTAPYVLPP